MKLYENIIIGNFLYSLGFAVGARAQGNTPSVINLLQQTPADKLLGDLLLEFPGVVRLIEFKSEDNRSNKEKARHTMLSQMITAEPELKPISRTVHWYIETAAPDRGVAARIVPYLDAFPSGSKGDRLELFIASLAKEVASRNSEIARESIRRYLEWVKTTQGGGVIGTGGLLLVANADGTLHYAQLFDILELRLQHREWIGITNQRLERELSYQLERQHQIERSGPSHGRGR